MGGGGQGDLKDLTDSEKLDQQINQSIQNREIEKARKQFYDELRGFYNARKTREIITTGCAKHCLGKAGFYKDDLTRAETDCLTNCYHKYYRYMTYSNTLYTYLTSDNRESIQESINQWEDDEESPEPKLTREEVMETMAKQRSGAK